MSLPAYKTIRYAFYFADDYTPAEAGGPGHLRCASAGEVYYDVKASEILSEEQISGVDAALAATYAAKVEGQGQ